jgi:uncharacterized protein YbjT (DUF2867 family)
MPKTKLFVTGATGNVGMAVIDRLQNHQLDLDVVAGVRDLENDEKKLSHYRVTLAKFDFADTSTHEAAFQNCELLFLMRPPQISKTQVFEQMIRAAKTSGIRHIIFLSVQGVEKSRLIPHHKIEQQIVASGIPYTFLRPAYFMQNFTTTLRDELVNHQRIFLPAGLSKFTLVDVGDIADTTLEILRSPDLHRRRSYELTSRNKMTFQEMADALSRGLGRQIEYQSPNLWHFYFSKRKQGIDRSYILVLIMLHYLPRFQAEPQVSDCIRAITGREPVEFDQFVTRETPHLLRVDRLKT